MVNRGLIFDVGMAAGGDTRFYLAKGFRVLAVEADPVTAAAGRMAFAEDIRRGRLKILEAAVSDQAGRQTFYCNRQQPNWGSLQPGWGGVLTDALVPVEVETVTLPALFARYGVPYYVKIDVEGADERAVAPLVGSPQRPPYISVEAHSAGGLRSLHAAGYQSFKLVNHTMLWKVQLPDPSREGRFVPMSNWQGASGPFGLETPGEAWLSIAEAIEFLEMFHNLAGRQQFMVPGWVDAHARLDPPGAG